MPAAPLSRRSVLKAAAAALPAAGAATALAQDGTATPDATTGRDAPTPQAAGPAGVSPAATGGPHPGVIVRQWEPRNLEYPFPSLDGRITPTNQHYVRSHFAVPRADAKDWTLTVEGEGVMDSVFTLADLEALGTEERTVTMECAGNGRIFLVPKPSGLLWESGGVGTAVWRGTPLRKVLNARPASRLVLPYDGVPPFRDMHVRLRGADHGKLSAYPAPLHYSRGMPMAKALDDVLLATHMNGEPLPRHHGYPLRAIVPGWYGAASVKWLDRISVTTEPDRGFFSTFDYATFEGPQAQLTPLTDMQVKSSLARPARGERVQAGSTYTVAGAAWTGGGRTVQRVEVSADGGAAWADATLIDEPEPHVWSRWRYDWKVPAEPGDVTLTSRATDSAGNVQPAEHDPLHRAYKIHFTVPVGVEVV